MYVIGIDPGPVAGVALIGGPTLEIECAQATPGALWALLDGYHGAYMLTAIAAERFVVGSRAGRSKTAQASEVTRKILGVLPKWAEAARIPYVERSASEVKPWATDERLAAAGLLEITKGMRHARDGARHALFCAVKNYGLPDPLSRRAA